MGRAEAGSAKALANAQKARGLTKLRFYCQVCSKPCRDANGYKCHIQSDAHLRQLQAITGAGGSQAGKVIDKFSQDFEREFVKLLSRRYGTRRIRANLVYNEYIQDRHHLHMNATRWLSLASFVKHLGRTGVAKVEEDEQVPGSWYIQWIDNSSSTLARQDAAKKMDRAKLDDESRQRRLLDQQVKAAQEAAAKENAKDSAAEAGKRELQRDESSQPIKIGLSQLKSHTPAASSTSTSGSTQALNASSSPGGIKIGLSASTAHSAGKPAAVRPMGLNAFRTATKATPSPAPSAAPVRKSALDELASEIERKRTYGPDKSSSNKRPRN